MTRGNVVGARRAPSKHSKERYRKTKPASQQISETGPRDICRNSQRQVHRHMPEVIFSGPAGRIEGRYTKAKEPGAPIALLLHPHPQFGGTMNNPIVHALYYMFVERGFSVLRFNFRGVGRSQGLFENGAGELSDAASALDWLQSFNRETRICWLVG